MPPGAARLDIEEGRRRVTAICSALPEVVSGSRTGQHTGFSVRGKAFAYYLVDHHGDGRTAFSCRLSVGAQQALVDAQPHRFFVAPYTGRYGWIVLDLDAGPLDWAEVEALARESYAIVAPKKLAAMVEMDGQPGASQPL